MSILDKLHKSSVVLLFSGTLFTGLSIGLFFPQWKEYQKEKKDFLDAYRDEYFQAQRLKQQERQRIIEEEGRYPTVEELDELTPKLPKFQPNS